MNKPDTNHLTALLRDSLQNGRQPQLTVTSNSMAPLIRAGDVVIITALGVDLQPGDIITFENSSGLLTHRFWGFVPDNHSGTARPLLTTRGDKPLWFDPPLDSAHIVGRVQARLRGQHRLNLETGRGRWLNRHLAWLATFENRVVISGALLSSGPTIHPQKTDIPWVKRLIHWTVYGWATGLTAVIDLVN